MPRWGAVREASALPKGTWAARLRHLSATGRSSLCAHKVEVVLVAVADAVQVALQHCKAEVLAETMPEHPPPSASWSARLSRAVHHLHLHSREFVRLHTKPRILLA